MRLLDSESSSNSPSKSRPDLIGIQSRSLAPVAGNEENSRVVMMKSNVRSAERLRFAINGDFEEAICFLSLQSVSLCTI
ncbi:hypothetical protein LguiB_021300 [Lonicera macranthoides]